MTDIPYYVKPIKLDKKVRRYIERKIIEMLRASDGLENDGGLVFQLENGMDRFELKIPKYNDRLAAVYLVLEAIIDEKKLYERTNGKLYPKNFQTTRSLGSSKSRPQSYLQTPRTVRAAGAIPTP